MPRITDVARVTLAGSTGVDHTAPLEDLVQETYRVARRYAELHGFTPQVFRNKAGLVGPLVMSRLVRQLFPGMNEDEAKRTQSLINQVLRKTDGAVCVRRPPERAEGEVFNPDKHMPTWFIADTMPQDIVIVALSYAKKSAEQRPLSSTGFDEKLFLRPGEKKLRADEVGEDQQPGEVTVTHIDQAKDSSTRREQAFADARNKRRDEHLALVQRVLEEVQTADQPLAATDVATIINRDDNATWNQTTIRGCLSDLIDSGQLVTRKETPVERLIRGGGKNPKATSPLLYWPAPGPVPERTRLPAGIEPLRGASEWATETAMLFEADAGKILAVMNRQGYRGDQAPRSIKQISEESGVGYDRTREVLEQLVSQGRAQHRGHGWYPAELRRQRRAPLNQPTSTPDVSLPATEPEDKVSPSPAQPPAGDNLQLVLELARKLGVTLPGESLEQENRRLTEHNSTLAAELSRARDQVDALKNAIATLS